MSNQVIVIDALSNTTLFETTMEKIDEAYVFAAQMEEVGLDVRILTPGLNESFIQTLGATQAEIEQYKQELAEEIAEHQPSDLGCVVCPEKSDK